MNILITGANRGLGFALTQLAVEMGHTAIAGVRPSSPSDKLMKLKEEFPNKVDIVSIDVTNEEMIRTSASAVGDKHGHLDVIINNAGVRFPHEAPLENINIETFINTFWVNTFGPLMVAKYFISLMYNGADTRYIVNITTRGLCRGNKRIDYGEKFIAYDASKIALQLISGRLANMLKGENIKVYSLHPGSVKTDMGAKNGKIEPRESAEGIMNIITGKVDIPDDILYIDYHGSIMN